MTYALNGYVKHMNTALIYGNSPNLISGNLIHNRINFKINFSDRLNLRAEMRNRVFYGEQVKTSPGLGQLLDTDPGAADLSFNSVHDTAVIANHIFDRLLLNWTGHSTEITLGRQRINWGINTVWNPNDVFNTYNFFDFDYQERPGTDALRVRYSSGVSELDIAVKTSLKQNEMIAALLYRSNFKRYDVQGSAGLYKTDLFAGAGWAGNLGKNGFKGEISCFVPRKTLSSLTGSSVSASFSLDRSFKKGYFATVSYLFNSLAVNRAGSIYDLSNATLSAKNLMPFRHTGFAQLGKDITPLINATLALMFSGTGNTLILVPAVSVSLSQNWDLSLLSQSMFSQNGAIYASAGHGLYLRLRWSF